MPLDQAQGWSGESERFAGRVESLVNGSVTETPINQEKSAFESSREALTTRPEAPVGPERPERNQEQSPAAPLETDRERSVRTPEMADNAAEVAEYMSETAAQASAQAEAAREITPAQARANRYLEPGGFQRFLDVLHLPGSDNPEHASAWLLEVAKKAEYAANNGLLAPTEGLKAA